VLKFVDETAQLAHGLTPPGAPRTVPKLVNGSAERDGEIFFRHTECRVSARALRVNRLNLFSAFRQRFRKFFG